MSSDQVRPWLFTLLRGLLVIAIASGFAWSGLGSGSRLEQASHDQVSDAGIGTPTNFRESGSPRVVKRLVGVEHLAINASVPDEIVAQAPCVDLPLVETTPIVRRSCDIRGCASVRGPPVDLTI